MYWISLQCSDSSPRSCCPNSTAVLLGLAATTFSRFEKSHECGATRQYTYYHQSWFVRSCDRSDAIASRAASHWMHEIQTVSWLVFCLPMGHVQSLTATSTLRSLSSFVYDAPCKRSQVDSEHSQVMILKLGSTYDLFLRHPPWNSDRKRICLRRLTRSSCTTFSKPTKVLWEEQYANYIITVIVNY